MTAPKCQECGKPLNPKIVWCEECGTVVMRWRRQPPLPLQRDGLILPPRFTAEEALGKRSRHRVEIKTQQGEPWLEWDDEAREWRQV